MRRRYSISYFLSTGLKSFKRNGFMNTSAIVILISAMLICGTFSLVFINLDHNVSQIDDYNEIVVYADIDATDEELAQLEADILAHKNTKSVTFVPKEEGIVNVRESFGDQFEPLFEKYEKDRINPLPDSFVVEFESVNGFEELKLYLDNEVENIDQVSSHLDIAKRVNQIKNIILVVSIVLTALLAIVSWFIIANTIKLTFKYREDEINIMKYIGATNFFIACPFVVESCVVALLSSGIAYAIQYFAYDYVCKIVAEQYPMIQTVPIESLRLILAAAFFGATFILCLFGTIFSTRHYSKV